MAAIALGCCRDGRATVVVNTTHDRASSGSTQGQRWRRSVEDSCNTRGTLGIVGCAGGGGDFQTSKALFPLNFQLQVLRHLSTNSVKTASGITIFLNCIPVVFHLSCKFLPVQPPVLQVPVHLPLFFSSKLSVSVLSCALCIPLSTSNLYLLHYLGWQ